MISIQIGGTSYSLNAADSVVNLAQGWQFAEFNIFGDCCSAQANFNSGAALVVRTNVDYGSTSAPSCSNGGYTGETNNLSFATAPSAAPDTYPAIWFTESTAGGASSPCNAATAIAAALTQNALTVSVTGIGTVTSNPAGIICPSTCSANFVNGTSVTLTATPPSGWAFAGWSGACSGSGNCVVTMNSTQSVSAMFKQTTATLLSSSPNSSTVGQSVTLTATVTTSLGIPTGSVNFYGDGGALNVSEPLSGWNATFSTSAFGAGSHSITATYSGDANFASSTSPTLTQVVRSVAHDFNGDHLSDILWHHNGGGVGMWLMNGTTPTAEAGLGAVDPAWQIAGTASLVQSTGDFDGDGKADILWRHSGGDVAIWEMNGTTPKLEVDIGNVPTSWQIAGVGDFDGDGKADILWRHSGGDVAIWEMNGTTPKLEVDIGNVPTSWQIAGVGDFDGDGKADILWRHSGGDVAIWEMNGTTPTTELDIGNVPIAWQIVGASDFDGDGRADILWRQTGGDVAIWEMNGTAAKLAVDIGNVPNAWQIVSTGDYDGDGKSDILWRNSDGSLGLWEMNGTTPKAEAGLGTVDTAWTVVE